MAEPPAKKAKTEAEDEQEPELEKDAAAEYGPKIKEAPGFHVEDTTMNIMPSSTGNMLMPLTDAGLHYLVAGARASVGIKSGRYMFEVKILEMSSPFTEPSARSRFLHAQSQLRIGVALAGSSLFVGESEESVCFDSEGAFFKDKKKTAVSQKFVTGDVMALVLNLAGGPNGNTVSLFKNGERACKPQPLPENLKGKALFPAISFRNVACHYNFGPTPVAPLPFKCHMISEAAQKDAVLQPSQAPKDGKYEVVFPICLPDEGGFDWLDQFLATKPYTEISDRALLNWCEKSGLSRPKGYSPAARNSNDKPELALGIKELDDLSVRRVLQTMVPLQKRNFVVMEVRSSLLKWERKELVSRWAGFKRVASVIVGEPPAAFKTYSQELMLKMKQEAAIEEVRMKHLAKKQKRELEKRQKQFELAKKKQLKKQEKQQEYLKRKQEAEEKGETVEEMKEDEDEEEEEVEEPLPEEEEAEPMEEPAKVELSIEEKKLTFRRSPVPDIAVFAHNTSFQNFSLPGKDEDCFDEIKWLWQPEAAAQKHVQDWIQLKKLTSRIEDLMPGEWFTLKLKEWQKLMQSYQTKHKAWTAAQAEKEAERRMGKEKEEGKVNFEHLDVFGIENVLDVGGGEPLFGAFNFEDWSLLGLRYEMHLLSHAYRKDANDPDRISPPVEHLGFYYQRYFKRQLNYKFYGVTGPEELLDLVRDTVLITGKTKVIEAQLPEQLESTNLFVMLTEESRRDRKRRIDLGDETAKLKISAPVQVAPKPLVQPMAIQQQPQQQQQQQPLQQQQFQQQQSWQAGAPGAGMGQPQQWGSFAGGKGGPAGWGNPAGMQQGWGGGWGKGGWGW